MDSFIDADCECTIQYPDEGDADFEKRGYLDEQEIDILTRCIVCDYIVGIRGRQRIDWGNGTDILLFLELLVPVDTFFGCENFTESELLRLSKDYSGSVVKTKI